MGGRFTLSDDSHDIGQIGLNYSKVLDCVRRAGITELWHLTPAFDASVPLHDARFPDVLWNAVPVTELSRHAFWST